MDENEFKQSIKYRIMYLINHYSNYQITKKTGIYENTLARLRGRQANVGNVALNTAALLDTMSQQVYHMHPTYDTSTVAKDVAKVIMSHLSTYYLIKHMNAPYNVLYNLRIKRSSVARLYLKSAIAIADFYQAHRKLVDDSKQQPVYITNGMRRNVKDLIHSDYRPYYVAKAAHLQPSVTSRLFRGVTKVDNARPKTIYLLNHFYNLHKNDAFLAR